MNLDINIPSAKEARNTIKKGEYEKAHFYEMEPCVKVKLEEMGYKINIGEGRNETYYCVRWNGDKAISPFKKSLKN